MAVRRIFAMPAAEPKCLHTGGERELGGRAVASIGDRGDIASDFDTIA
jgi:hypothetical protein